MAARTVTTREFICNHCNEGDMFDNDADAGKAGWALVRVNGQEFALCAEHYDELKRFLNVDTLGGMPGVVNPLIEPGDPGYGAIMAANGIPGSISSVGGGSYTQKLAAEAAEAGLQRQQRMDRRNRR